MATQRAPRAVVAAGVEADAACAGERINPDGNRSWVERVKSSVRDWFAVGQAAAVAALPMAAVGASLITVAAYLALAGSLAHPEPQGSSHPLIAIAFNFLGAWVVLASVWHILGYTTAMRANAGSYGQLLARLLNLRIRHECLCGADAIRDACQTKRIACKIVGEHCCRLEENLK